MRWPDSYAPGRNLVLDAARSGTEKCFPRRALAPEVPSREGYAPRPYRVPALQLVRRRLEHSQGRRFARPPTRDDKAPPPAEHRFATVPERNLRMGPGSPPALPDIVGSTRRVVSRARGQDWAVDLVRRPPKNTTMPQPA